MKPPVSELAKRCKVSESSEPFENKKTWKANKECSALVRKRHGCKIPCKQDEDFEHQRGKGRDTLVCINCNLRVIEIEIFKYDKDEKKHTKKTDRQIYRRHQGEGCANNYGVDKINKCYTGTTLLWLRHVIPLEIENKVKRAGISYKWTSKRPYPARSA